MPLNQLVIKGQRKSGIYTYRGKSTIPVAKIDMINVKPESFLFLLIPCLLNRFNPGFSVCIHDI